MERNILLCFNIGFGVLGKHGSLSVSAVWSPALGDVTAGSVFHIQYTTLVGHESLDCYNNFCAETFKRGNLYVFGSFCKY